MVRMWDIEDLATVSMLADLFGVGLSAVSNWSKRYETFPAPIFSEGNAVLYSLTQVIDWYETHEWDSRGRHKHL